MALKINQWTQLLVNKKRCQENADGKRKEKNPHCFRWATANHHCTRIRFALLENSLSFVKQRVVQEVWMLGCVFVFVPSHYNFQRALFVHVWRSYKSRYRVSVCCVKNGETRSDSSSFLKQVKITAPNRVPFVHSPSSSSPDVKHGGVWRACFEWKRRSTVHICADEDVWLETREKNPFFVNRERASLIRDGRPCA